MQDENQRPVHRVGVCLSRQILLGYCVYAVKASWDSAFTKCISAKMDVADGCGTMQSNLRLFFTTLVGVLGLKSVVSVMISQGLIMVQSEANRALRKRHRKKEMRQAMTAKRIMKYLDSGYKKRVFGQTSFVEKGEAWGIRR